MVRLVEKLLRVSSQWSGSLKLKDRVSPCPKFGSIPLRTWTVARDRAALVAQNGQALPPSTSLCLLLLS